MIRTRTLRTLALVTTLGLTLTLAACGGDDSSTAASGSDPAGTSASSDEGGATDGSSTEGSEAPEVTDSGGGDGGSCQVDVTGDVTASWSAGPSLSALETEYWLTPQEKEMFGEGFYFVVNCQGPGGDYFGLTAGQAGSTDTVAYGPASYTLSPSENVLAGTGMDSPLTVLLAFDGDEGVWGVTEPGVVEITEFDGDNIAGTVIFTASDMLAEMAGTPERTVQVTVTFDFDNPS
jgi:hypothetical protein